MTLRVGKGVAWERSSGMRVASRGGGVEVEGGREEEAQAVRRKEKEPRTKGQGPRRDE